MNAFTVSLPSGLTEPNTTSQQVTDFAIISYISRTLIIVYKSYVKYKYR